MKYRRFNMLDWEVSVLGASVNQLPLIDEDNFNETESIKMIRYAIDHGVNYLDLGYSYHMKQHESLTRLINRALQDGYRQKIKVAANLPSILINTFQDFDRYFNEQLLWLNIDMIDFYILGELNRETWPKLKKLNVLEWAECAMNDGRIDKLGFSIHDDFQVLKTILNAYDNWSLCKFQYSYMDHLNHHPGATGLKYIADKGLMVVITEPLRGGKVTKGATESIAKLWANAPQERTLNEWGLRWAWNNPGVSTVVSDMNSMEQVIENLALADSAEPDNLTVQELLLLNQVKDAYFKLRPIFCPSCRCCMPCPVGIDVPRILELYNDAIIYNDIETAQFIFRLEQHSIDNCIECGACEKACPRKIAILHWLKKTKQLLGE